MGLPGVKLSESEPSGRTAAVLNEQAEATECWVMDFHV